MLYFEDLNIGQKISIGPISVTEEEIIEFAKKFDPQPFHLDAVESKRFIVWKPLRFRLAYLFAVYENVI